tara:strand:+ start:48153 stop:48326 length:174 start_codon:yes stop_codon:yes gene_type:complete
MDKPSVIAASLIQTLAWKGRKIKFITHAEEDVINNVLFRILPLIGADKLIEDNISNP